VPVVSIVRHYCTGFCVDSKIASSDAGRVEGSEPPELRALAQVVKDLRRKQHLSQEHFGYASGLHRNHIGQIERAELSPSLGVLLRVADAGGITFTELARRIEEAINATSSP
jgi:DNA-binding XRE family transcriptional regulator